ncbi:hypothetical protein IWZ03DRAFT_26030 [Phyllosticta citriasiana]|uniref:Uncharacterized protein n=1 Tax=Phyllosticta citriasiana TaxID=595635 RepID=A0ABR1L080_9PEZI
MLPLRLLGLGIYSLLFLICPSPWSSFPSPSVFTSTVSTLPTEKACRADCEFIGRRCACGNPLNSEWRIDAPDGKATKRNERNEWRTEKGFQRGLLAL